MNHRKLRIAWSVTWAVVAVLLVVLWVRSYLRIDFISDNIPPNHATGTERGELLYVTSDLPAGRVAQKWGYHAYPRDPRGPAKFDSFLGFAWSHSGHAFTAAAPLWLFTLMAALTSVPWYWRFNQFSLRTLLIATTLVAVGLGLVMWLLR